MARLALFPQPAALLLSALRIHSCQEEAIVDDFLKPAWDAQPSLAFVSALNACSQRTTRPGVVAKGEYRTLDHPLANIA